MRTLIVFLGTMLLASVSGCDIDDCIGTAACKMEGKCKNTAADGKDPACIVGDDQDAKDQCKVASCCKSAGQCSPGPVDCTSTTGPCKKPDTCTTTYNCCVVKKEADCVHSAGCAKSGNCGLSPRNSSTLDTTDKREKNCAPISTCKCAPRSSLDCSSSTDCDDKGLCSMLSDACVAASDTDCKNSKACTDSNKCTALNGECV